MSDVEARLRESLHEALDPIAAEAARGAAAVRRARRGRAVRGVAAGLAAAVFVAGAALAITREPGEDAPRPASEPEQVATFLLDFRPGSGTLTVDVPKAQVCLGVGRDAVIGGAQVEYEPPGSLPIVVAAMGHGGNPHTPRCRPVDPSSAARVIAEPHHHQVVLPGFATRAAFLDPFDLSPTSAPDVLEIVCSQDGAVAMTPQARPRLDGVRLRIHNQGGAWRGFEVSSPDGRFGGGGLRRDRIFEKTWPIDPGPHGIRCLREPRAQVYDPEHPDFAQFTIVDPYGLWNDPALECGAGDQRRRIKTATRVPDPWRLPDFDQLIRDYLPGVEPDDVLERPRYPESEFKLETRTLIREGRKIATLYLGSARVPGSRRDHRWAIMPVVCPGSRIAGG